MNVLRSFNAIQCGVFTVRNKEQNTSGMRAQRPENEIPRKKSVKTQAGEMRPKDILEAEFKNHLNSAS
jgi:hypothetical protein